MDKNFHKISVQDAMKLAQSDAGKQLLAHLQQQNAAEVRSAMSQASAGNYEQAKQTINALLSDPQTKALLEQLGRIKNE